MRKIILQLSCVLLLLGSLSWADTVGTLAGKITGTNGAPVANATVTITNAVTNASTKVLTGPDGGFSVAGLPPGTYRVDVDAPGFNRTSKPDIKLVAGPPQALTINLVAGNGYQSVELRGTAPAIQSDGGTLSIALDTRTVRELPVIDRNHQQLVDLQTGVTPPFVLFNLVQDPDRNRFFSVNGQSIFSNFWMLDGVQNQEPYRSTAVRVVPEEAIYQLQIQTASLPAQAGFVGGGLLQSVTRPGTNDFHGSLFEFYSGNPLRARNFFNVAGNPDARFVYNQFGGAGGGRISKDKAFLFGSYEGTYLNGFNTQLSTVPTTAALNGNFSAVPGLVLFNPNTGTVTGLNRTPFPSNIIPANQISPISAAIASFMPAPNLPGFTNNLVNNVGFSDQGNKADGKFDYRFNDSASAFLRYGYTNFWSAQASPFGQVIGAGTRGHLVAQNAIGDVVYSLSPAVITDFRFGYNRYAQAINTLSDQTALGATLGNPNLFNNLIGLNISGFAPLGTPSYVPEHGVDNTFNWVWTWSWHRGSHNIKWGVDIRRNRTDGFTEFPWNPFGPNGTAFFGPGTTMSANGPGISQFGVPYNSFAGFLVNSPSQVGLTNFFSTPTIRQSQYGGWAGDTVQLAHRITVDFGVRYEVYTPLEPMNSGGAAFFDPTTNTFNYAGIGNISMRPWRTDTDSVAGRFGISYRATNKTVVRAGYSMQYFSNPYGLTGVMPSIFGASNGVQGGFTTVSPIAAIVNFANLTPASIANGNSADNLPATFIPRNLDTPYVQSFNAQVQQEFYYGTVLSVGYVGAVDRHLPFSEQLNSAFPGTGVAGLPFIGLGRVASTQLYDTGLTSNYNSLQVSLNRRFAQGLSFTAAYTFSRALGYTTGTGYLINPFDLHSNYGPLDFDRQHVLTFSHLWELPFGRHSKGWKAAVLGGWQVNGIFTWDSGTPITITADPIGCACPGNTVLTNLTGSTTFINNGTQVLNPAAFTAPGFGTFGTLGRNTLRAPGYRNYDASVFKRFRVRDRANLEFRGEMFNVGNTPRFQAPITNINSPDFGQQVATVPGAYGRQANVALRVMF
jgi:hypothetical protein